MSYNETIERQYLRSIPQQGIVGWIAIRPNSFWRFNLSAKSLLTQTQGWKAIILKNPPLASGKSR